MVPEGQGFNVHQAAYQGRYEEVKEKVLANNRLLTALDDVSPSLLSCFVMTLPALLTKPSRNFRRQTSVVKVHFMHHSYCYAKLFFLIYFDVYSERNKAN